MNVASLPRCPPPLPELLRGLAPEATVAALPALAAPVFSRVAAGAMRLLHVAPDPPAPSPADALSHGSMAD